MALEDFIYDGTRPSDVVSESQLSGIAHTALTPLMWLGETLDKPGRALRGLLAGQPSELLNLVPFSDTMGITDPNKSVGGRDLLRHYGLVDDEDNWGNFFGGLATEVVLDPLNFFTFGTKSSLTAAGKAAAKENALAKTALGRLAEGQSGLMGLRTPWFTDMLGLPKASMPLLTGNAGVNVLENIDKYAGMARSAIDRFAPGRAVTGAYDTAASRLKSWFVPGHGITGDKRIEPVFGSVYNDAEDAALASTFDQRMKLTDSVRNAHEYMASKGIPSVVAEDVIRQGVPAIVEGTDLSKFGIKDQLHEYLAGTGASPEAIKEIKDGVRQHIEQIASASPLADIARQKAIESGVKVGQDKSVWGGDYFPRQSQGSEGLRSGARQSRLIPDEPLPGRGAQLDAYANDPQFSGFAKQEIPAGMTVQQWRLENKRQVLENAKKIYETARGERDIRWPREAGTADIAAAATETVAPVVNHGEALTRLMSGKTLADPAAVKELMEISPHLGDNEFGSALMKLMKDMDLVPKAKRQEIARAIDAPMLTGDQAVGKKIKDMVVERILEHKAGAAPASPQTPMTVSSNRIIAGDTAESAIRRHAPTMSIEAFAEEVAATPAIANSGVAKTLMELAPDMKDDTFGAIMKKFADDLSVLDGAGKKRLAKDMGIKSQAGKTIDESIIERLAESKVVPPEVSSPKPKVPLPASPAAPIADAVEDLFNLPYPSKLADDRLWEKSKELAGILSEMDPQIAKEGRGFYRGDPIGAYTKYVDSMAMDAAKGRSALSVLAKEAVPFDQIKGDPGKYIDARKALAKIGLVGRETEIVEGGRMAKAGGDVTLMGMLGEAGKTSSPLAEYASSGMALSQPALRRELQGHFVPRDLVDLLRAEIEGPRAGTKFMQGAENFTSALRSWFTLPWIPFHTRNAWEGALQQGLGGGLGKEALHDATLYRAGALTDKAKISELTQFANEAFNSKAAFRHQAADMIGSSVLGEEAKTLRPWVEQGGKFTESVKGWVAGFTPGGMKGSGQSLFTFNPEKSVLIQQGMKASAAQDDIQRFAQFVGLRREGYSPAAAAKIVTDSHLDYSKLTPFERQVRNVVPYYTFSRRNISRIAGQAGDPGPLASLLRAGTEGSEEGFVPGYVSQGSAIPIPGGADGQQRYISGLSMPYDDEIFGALTALAQGNFTEAGRRALQTVNPLIKAPYAIATNRNLYTGKSLDEMAPTGLAALLPGTSGNKLAEILGATPVGRLATTVNSAIGGKDAMLPLKLLTGIKTTDVDTAMASQYAAKEVIANELKRTGMVGVAERLYPKAEYRDEPPERLAALLQLMKAIDSTGQQMRKERLAP